MSKRTRDERTQAQSSPPSRKDETIAARAESISELRSTTAKDAPAAPPRARKGEGPSHEQIAARAYQLWEARGRPGGADWENWFEAERALRAGVPSSSRN
jgi:hypothetical protein